jgi:hypothetical protein
MSGRGHGPRQIWPRQPSQRRCLAGWTACRHLPARRRAVLCPDRSRLNACCLMSCRLASRRHGQPLAGSGHRRSLAGRRARRTGRKPLASRLRRTSAPRPGRPACPHRGQRLAAPRQRQTVTRLSRRPACRRTHQRPAAPRQRGAVTRRSRRPVHTRLRWRSVAARCRPTCSGLAGCPARRRRCQHVHGCRLGGRRSGARQGHSRACHAGRWRPAAHCRHSRGGQPPQRVRSADGLHSRSRRCPSRPGRGQCRAARRN